LLIVHNYLFAIFLMFGKADQTEKETGGTEVDIQTGDTGGNI